MKPEAEKSDNISIHPPREGWDAADGEETWKSFISIHPPREGWDFHVLQLFPDLLLFQSTHPVRGGT